jgi:hypothetical protein
MPRTKLWLLEPDLMVRARLSPRSRLGRHVTIRL